MPLIGFIIGGVGAAIFWLVVFCREDAAKNRKP